MKMIKKILISYADQNMSYSLKRLGKEAKKLGIFDEIRLYTELDIPKYLLDSPLLKYKRGGGYWSWKPALIWETLQEYGDDCIIVYLDAGCAVNKSDEWNVYFDFLNDYNTICFQYKDCMPEWEKFGQTSTLIKYWTKDSTIDFFRNYLCDNDYGSKYNKIMGGVLFFKGADNKFVRTWLDLTINNPELIIDPTDKELENGNKELAYHKHDQSVITPLAHHFSETVLILTETSETSTDGPIVGARIRTRTYFDYLKLKTKNNLRGLLGGSIYNSVKKLIKGK